VNGIVRGPCPCQWTGWPLTDLVAASRQPPADPFAEMTAMSRALAGVDVPDPEPFASPDADRARDVETVETFIAATHLEHANERHPDCAECRQVNEALDAWCRIAAWKERQ
jgi:hypothetical protein